MTDQPWPLPSGWSWQSFGAVATVASDLVDPVAFTNWRHLAPNHVESETGRLLSTRSVAEDGVTSPKHRFRRGQIIYSKIRPYLAKAVIAPYDGLCSADMYPIDTELDVRFLWRWILSREFTRRAAAQQARTVLPKINRRALEKLPVPVPPLPEQRRIVDILEDHLSRLDAADADLSKSLRSVAGWSSSATDRLLFSTPLPRVAVGALLKEKMRNGHSATKSSNGVGIRTLTLSAITKRAFNNEYTKLTTADSDRVAGLWLERGDILVQRSNTPELVGSSALYSGPSDWAIFPDLLIRIRADETRVTAEYLAAALRSQRSHRALRHRAKGLASSMPKIDQDAIASLLLPVPERLEDQAILVQRISGIHESEARLLTACREGRNRCARLKRALLEAAFSGQLTGRSSDMDRVEEMANV